MVLLKNSGNLLPLDKNKIKTIAVIGHNAYPAVIGGGGSSLTKPFNSVSYLEGISNYLGTSARVLCATPEAPFRNHCRIRLLDSAQFPEKAPLPIRLYPADLPLDTFPLPCRVNSEWRKTMKQRRYECGRWILIDPIIR